MWQLSQTYATSSWELIAIQLHAENAFPPQLLSSGNASTPRFGGLSGRSLLFTPDIRARHVQLPPPVARRPGGCFLRLGVNLAADVNSPSSGAVRRQIGQSTTKPRDNICRSEPRGMANSPPNRRKEGASWTARSIGWHEIVRDLTSFGGPRSVRELACSHLNSHSEWRLLFRSRFLSDRRSFRRWLG